MVVAGKGKPTITERRYSVGLVIKGHALGVVQGSSITARRLFGSLLTHILISPSGPAGPGCVWVGARWSIVGIGIWRCVAPWLLIAIVGMNLSGWAHLRLSVMLGPLDVARCSSGWRIVPLLRRIAGARGRRVGLLIPLGMLTVRGFFCFAFTYNS